MSEIEEVKDVWQKKLPVAIWPTKIAKVSTDITSTPEINPPTADVG